MPISVASLVYNSNYQSGAGKLLGLGSTARYSKTPESEMKDELFIIREIQDISYFSDYIKARELLKEAREHIMTERAKLYFNKIVYIKE